MTDDSALQPAHSRPILKATGAVRRRRNGWGIPPGPAAEAPVQLAHADGQARGAAHGYCATPVYRRPAALGNVAGGRSLSVNASGSELRSPDYVGAVREALGQSGVLPGNLVIEVTESTLDADQPAVIDTLRRLRDMGVLIAIDDFGTGYSSLSRLDRLPADILKIDRTFVAAMPDGGGPIMQALIALAHGLKLIETHPQADIQRRLDCDKGQGYLFGRPQYVPRPGFPHTVAADRAPATIASSVGRTNLTGHGPEGTIGFVPEPRLHALLECWVVGRLGLEPRTKGL